MIRRTALLIMAIFLLTPSAALADGPVDPIATSYVARVVHTPAGLAAKVVDGYLQMWLHVPAEQNVEVLDLLGAPYLHFTAGGVYVNHNSQLYYLSQTPVEAIPPSKLTAKTPPHWVKVSSGHSWLWRDGRLQAFAKQQLTPGSNYAGPWSIALVVNGAHTTLHGGLYYQPTPSVVWFWPVLVILLCVLALWRLGSARLDRRIATGLCSALFAALVIVALARLLHGRPSVSGVQVGELVVALIATGTAAGLLIRGRFASAIPFVLAFVALWAGLTFLPILTHSHTLLILPGWLSRAATVTLLGGGLSLVLVAMRRPLAAPR